MCSILNCPNGYDVKNSGRYRFYGVSFHTFPLHLKKKWIEATGRIDWQPGPRSTICSNHFLESCYMPSYLRRRLHPDAVPTVNLPPEANIVVSEPSSTVWGAPGMYNKDASAQCMDRFKRRLIRTVARLREMGQPDLWQAVGKAMGKDCRGMWERMCQLTLKKMSRLLSAGDVLSRGSPLARMSFTDWLLCDLVLVHEEVDTLKAKEGGREETTLAALFSLVREFELELCPRDALAQRWVAAGLHYNQNGKQCSPMLLQRRWYELKKLTRAKFYLYWDTHRRTPQSNRPGELHVAIARRFPHIVTEELPSWQEMLKSGFVVLPEEFERILKFKGKDKASGSDADDSDDIVMIEPVIETIDLDLVSEVEEEIAINTNENDQTVAGTNRTDSPTPATAVATEITIEAPLDCDRFIKTETTDKSEISDGYSTADISSTEAFSTNVSMPPSDMLINESHVLNNMFASPVILKVETVAEEHFGTDSDKPESHNKENTSFESQVSKSINETAKVPSLQSDLEINFRPGPKCKKNYDIEISSKTSNYNRPGPKCIKNSSYRDIEQNLQTSEDDRCLQDDDIIEEESTVFSASKLCSGLDLTMPSTSFELDDMNDYDIDFVDDENEEAIHIDEATLNSIKQEHIKSIESEKDMVKAAVSLPIVLTSPDSSEEEASRDSADSNERSTSKFDLKLLMLPVVYTQKLNDMVFFKTMTKLPDTVLNSTTPLQEIESLSKPKSLKGMELNIYEDMDDCDINSGLDNYAEECLNDDDNYAEVSEADDTDVDDPKTPQVVDETSFLFQKPRTRNYTPINLCKNPDFNTRLRRLSVAFLMTARNRQLIKACKPLTVDVQKTFEEKLVAGVVLLKRHEEHSNKDSSRCNVNMNDIDSQNVTVAPSAMPAQTLFDKETVDIKVLTSVAVESMNADNNMLFKERQNEFIQVPDTENVQHEVGQINRPLPTAEVAPLQGGYYKSGNENHVYEIRRGPQGIEYKKQTTMSEPKVCPKRKLTPKAPDLPWYSRRTITKKSPEKYLLQIDSLQRMIKMLTPDAIPYRRPVRKRTYCCPAKRHKVLNEARCRLLINVKGEVRRRNFQKELIIHKCPPDKCKCCCKTLLMPSKSPPEPEQEKPIMLPLEPAAVVQQPIDQESEIMNAIEGLKSTNDQSAEEDYQPVVRLATPVTPLKQSTNKSSVTSPLEKLSNDSVFPSSLIPSTTQDKTIESDNNGDNYIEAGNKPAIIDLDNDCDTKTNEDLKQVGVNKTIITTQDNTIESDNNGDNYIQAGNKSAIIDLDNDCDTKTNEDLKQVGVNKTIIKQKVKRKRILKLNKNNVESKMVETGEMQSPHELIDLCDEDDIPETGSLYKFLKNQPKRGRGRPRGGCGSYTSEYRKWQEVKDFSKTAFGFNTLKKKRNKRETIVVLPEMFPSTSHQQNAFCEPLETIPSPYETETQNLLNTHNVSLDVPMGTRIMLLNEGQVYATSEDGVILPLSESQQTAVRMMVTVNTQNHSVIKDDSVPSNLIIDLEQEAAIPEIEKGTANSPQKIEETKNASLVTKLNDNRIDVDPTVKDMADNITNTGITTNSNVFEGVDATDIQISSVIESIEDTPLSSTSNTLDRAQTIEDDHIVQNKEGCETNGSPEKQYSMYDTSQKFLSVKNFAKMPSPIQVKSNDLENQNAMSTIKTSVLSDLMEISGISSEDTNVPVPSEEAGPITSHGIVQEWNSVVSEPNLLPVLISIGTPASGNTEQITTSPQGTFYVYNATTGLTTPIIVMEKSPVQATSPKKAKMPKLLPKLKKQNAPAVDNYVVEVVDSEPEGETAAGATSQLLNILQKKKAQKKLTKVIMVNSKEYLPKILKKQKNLKKYEDAEYVDYKEQNRPYSVSKKNKKKTRQKNAQVEARIDLVDSDAPMEEEYLVDSQESDCSVSPHPISRKRKCKPQLRKLIPVSLDIDDSSEDEPLSKIAAKRAKNNLQDAVQKDLLVSMQPNLDTADILEKIIKETTTDSTCSSSVQRKDNDNYEMFNNSNISENILENKNSESNEISSNCINTNYVDCERSMVNNETAADNSGSANNFVPTGESDLAKEGDNEETDSHCILGI